MAGATAYCACAWPLVGGGAGVDRRPRPLPGLCRRCGLPIDVVRPPAGLYATTLVEIGERVRPAGEPGVRVIDGKRFYSAAWLNDDNG